MKKRVILTVVALVVAPLLAGAPVAAQATCGVGFTGPDSNNMCTSTTTYQCAVNNTNSVTITNDTNQVVASGTVTTSGNTTGGSTTSGSVTNSSGTTFSVTINNALVDGEPLATCAATVVTPATEPPATPVKPAEQTQPQVLPFTGADTTLSTMGWVAAAMAVLAGLSVASVLVYRHFKALP